MKPGGLPPTADDRLGPAGEPAAPGDGQAPLGPASPPPSAPPAGSAPVAPTSEPLRPRPPASPSPVPTSLRTRSTPLILPSVLLVTDLLVLESPFLCVYWARFLSGWFPVPLGVPDLRIYLFGSLGVLVVFASLLYAHGMYDLRLRRRLADDIGGLLRSDVALPCPMMSSRKSGPFPSDYEFFRKVPFLKAIHRDAACPLLNNIHYRWVKAGERFISQGDQGDICYIVQSGTCQAVLEKNAKRHTVGLIKEREFVGEMSLLTGEPCSAHVEALTDMELWGIPWNVLAALLKADPEVGTFLTEIVAERFASRKITADRHIGKYVITDILGRGAFAIVYNGYHADLSRPVHSIMR